MRRFFLFFLVLLSSQILRAQNEITGVIVSKSSQQILPGANVSIEGTTHGTITDNKGNFVLKTAQALPFKLKVSYIGFDTQTITVENTSPLRIELAETLGLLSEVTVTGNRVNESIVKTAVSIEQIDSRKLQQSPAFDSYGALQNIKGVDLLSQSLLFKSVNFRGFGANNNNRFVQLTDGMDNRSPGLGFGFGGVAGVSDLDIESIELLPGASSALYGPDALQGLMLTKTKSPFDFPGFSAEVKTGANNWGKESTSPKVYTDVAVRYAATIGSRMAFKVNFQGINGTDFIADNYSDRSTRSRQNFFQLDSATESVRIGYVPNNDPSQNLQYDGLNIYGDDITNGGAFNFPSNYPNADLAGKLVTRTGYKEIDLLGNNGKIHSYRGSAAVHFKLTDKIEAIGAWYYGTGNFIRTAAFREYYPEYNRHQFKLELKSDEFFVRGYSTLQKAEGYNLGNLAARLLQVWKPTATWAQDFGSAYSGDITEARGIADSGKPLPGTPEFETNKSILIHTNNNKITSLGVNGVRLLDNSKLYHTEGMYNFKKILPEYLEVVTGLSFRRYSLLTEGTIFPLDRQGKEFTINEYGWYIQGSPTLKFTDLFSLKPTVALRYDKNQYFKGGFTPRISGVLSIGSHNFRASWQNAFRNPSPNQLLADGAVGEVGGSKTAVESANLIQNPGYTEPSVLAYRKSGNSQDLVKYESDPDKFTTEKIKTWEVGYRTLLQNKLYVDAYYFQSVYNDFIAAQNIIQPKSGVTEDLASASTSTTYQVNFNNFNEIFVDGFGVGAEYITPRGFNLGFNYSYQNGRVTLKDNSGNIRKDAFGKEVSKRTMSDPEVAAIGRNFFISPKDRFNITFSNSRVTPLLGFNITYRWTGKMWVEQGNTQGDVWLPAWNSLDAAMSLKITSLKTIVKVGGTNIFNQYYAQGYGLAQMGALYYISLNFDQFLK